MSKPVHYTQKYIANKHQFITVGSNDTMLIPSIVSQPNVIAMTIIPGGNVGIGTTKPTGILGLGINGAAFASPSGSMPLFCCRAWVNFDGSAGSGFRSAGNVTSVTRGTTGVYTINFTTPMSDTNYATIVTFDGAGTSVISGQPLISNKLTTSVTISLFRADTGTSTIRQAFGTTTDVNVVIFA